MDLAQVSALVLNNMGLDHVTHLALSSVVLDLVSVLALSNIGMAHVTHLPLDNVVLDLVSVLAMNSKGDVGQVQVELIMSTTDPKWAQSLLNQEEIARSGQGVAKKKEVGVTAYQVVGLVDMRVFMGNQEHVPNKAKDGAKVHGHLAVSNQIVMKGNQGAAVDK